MAPPDSKLLTREVLLAFWKVHILHHAEEGRIFGQWVLTELRRHGYDIGPGTLYPLLNRMERNGWLRREPNAGAGPRDRRYYRLTPAGSAVLQVLRDAVVELHHEVVEEAGPRPRTHAPSHLPGSPAARTPAPSRSPEQPSEEIAVASSCIAARPIGYIAAFDNDGRDHGRRPQPREIRRAACQ